MAPFWLTLLPDVILLCGGALFRRRLPLAGWQAIDTLNYYLLFPALILLSTLRSSPAWADLLVMGTGVWSAILFACLLGGMLRRVGPERFVDFAGLWQTAWRFNTAVALALVQVFPIEYRGLMSIAVGLAVPLANILAVSALARGQQRGRWHWMRQLLTNPFLLASVTGITLSLSGIVLPELLMQLLQKLAQAAIPLALLSIGAAINWQVLTQLTRINLALNSIKLLILPACMLLATQWLGVATAPSAVLVLFAALPTASAAHVLAAVFGADRSLVATLIAQSTLLACFTIPLWLLLIRQLLLS
ncbi:AEC family transporter [Alishewanella sp. 16-MA]|uniref:AEC family transporter n=1 Tax=Alishewanella maricola TaxID=2795740 RepID=A0ABS8C324_9ALTE|nr:AEC family transporter [Alishewanella maricola]MCB5226687.1 AEC family transporter [Alishewanella maricola]